MQYYLGLEIGGTKLQLGIGRGDGVLAALWRGPVDPAAGPEGIRRQIVGAIPELLERSGVQRGQLRGVGIGFGGPVDDATHTIIKSHQIVGWDDFPLAAWLSDLVGLPAVLGNDADVAGLAEALFGAGKGLSPIFYITIGSGIGGGLILDGEIYRGIGRGAAEIGHLRMPYEKERIPLEQIASGWGIQSTAALACHHGGEARILQEIRGDRDLSVPLIAEAAQRGDSVCQVALRNAFEALAEGICHVIALLCPRRIVVGGGVSLLGEQMLFEPVRRLVAERVFAPFAGRTDIVPAALGEEVVVHGALALTRKKLSKSI